MSVRTIAGRALVAAAVAVTTIIGTAAAAQAAVAPTIDVQAGRLVLNPGERGYQGTLTVTVTYQGDEPAYANLRFVEPVAGSFRTMRPIEACGVGRAEDGRSEFFCGVPRGELEPGETRRFRLDFEVLTAPRDVAMSAAPAEVEVSLSSDPSVSDTVTPRTLFRSTTGSLRQPQPYVQDTQSDLSVSAGDATLTRQDDGSYAGRVPVVVTWRGDAPHFEVGAEITLPEGVDFHGVDPSEVCAGYWCSVPGGRFAEGETRTFDLLVSVPADTPPGAVGAGSVRAYGNYNMQLPDVDPSDDIAAFTLTVA